MLILDHFYHSSISQMTHIDRSPWCIHAHRCFFFGTATYISKHPVHVILSEMCNKCGQSQMNGVAWCDYICFLHRWSMFLFVSILPAKRMLQQSIHGKTKLLARVLPASIGRHIDSFWYATADKSCDWWADLCVRKCRDHFFRNTLRTQMTSRWIDEWFGERDWRCGQCFLSGFVMVRHKILVLFWLCFSSLHASMLSINRFSFERSVDFRWTSTNLQLRDIGKKMG